MPKIQEGKLGEGRGGEGGRGKEEGGREGESCEEEHAFVAKAGSGTESRRETMMDEIMKGDSFVARRVRD